MNKICTSLEQSKKLLELGIDVETGDLWYIPIKVNGVSGYELTLNSSLTRGIIPAWSLTALLELIMPKGTTPVYVDNAYQMVYDIKPYYITSKFDNPLDAAFEMIVWLKENNKK